jgi:hypothetical protein
LYRSEGVTS